MGGEPLLHPRIADVITLTRRLLPRIRIVLATNGILLGRMGDEFWDALVSCGVELQVSAYPINMDYDNHVEMAKARGADAGFAMDLTGRDADKEAFLKVAIDPEGGQSPVRSFNSCFFGGSFMQLSRGSIWNCQVSAHHATLNAAFGWGMASEPADELPLASVTSIDDIESFRRSAHPMCRYCANDQMGVMAWERSHRDEREWRAQLREALDRYAPIWLIEGRKHDLRSTTVVRHSVSRSVHAGRQVTPVESERPFSPETLLTAVLPALVDGHCFQCDAHGYATVADTSRNPGDDADHTSRDKHNAQDEVRLLFAVHSSNLRLSSRYVSNLVPTQYTWPRNTSII